MGPQNVSCGGAPEQSEEPTEAQCADGHRFPNQFCPAGLMFNGQVCDWPENVDCGAEEAPEEPASPEEPEGSEEESYLECVWACKADKPIWQQFSCFTECAENEGETEGGEEGGEPEESCEDGIHPIPGDCTGFYQCSHGHQWPNQYCPANLLF